MNAPTKQMDHAAYMKKVRRMTDRELAFVIEDAREAIAAMPDNPNNGYYADEISYCGMEIMRRIKEVKPVK